MIKKDRNRLLVSLLAQCLVSFIFVLVLIFVFSINDSIKTKATEYDQEGTGFIVSSDGYIITNKHVIEADNGSVLNNYNILLDTKNYSASVVYFKRGIDLALLKITGVSTISCLSVVRDKPKIVDSYQFIKYSANKDHEVLFAPIELSTVSMIGVNEDVEDVGFNDQMSDRTIPTVINSGNSGSPLINANKDVVGVAWGADRADNASISNKDLIDFIRSSGLRLQCDTPSKGDPSKAIVHIIGTFKGD